MPILNKKKFKKMLEEGSKDLDSADLVKAVAMLTKFVDSARYGAYGCTRGLVLEADLVHGKVWGSDESK